VYEVGIAALCSRYDSVWVTALQAGSPLQWFSNLDLLLVAGVGSAFLAFRPASTVLGTKKHRFISQ
jgi:hypothetical protein